MQGSRLLCRHEYKNALVCYRKALADTMLNKHTQAIMYSGIVNIYYGLGQEEIRADSLYKECDI